MHLFAFLSKSEKWLDELKKSISAAQKKFPGPEVISQRGSENEKSAKFKDKLTCVGPVNINCL